MKLQFCRTCAIRLCFLHGVQCEKETYYLVTNLYVIDGFSVTIYDLCLSAEDDSSKRYLVVTSFRHYYAQLVSHNDRHYSWSTLYPIIRGM